VKKNTASPRFSFAFYIIDFLSRNGNEVRECLASTFRAYSGTDGLIQPDEMRMALWKLGLRTDEIQLSNLMKTCGSQDASTGNWTISMDEFIQSMLKTDAEESYASRTEEAMAL